MTAHVALNYFHLLTVAISITLLVLRFLWQWRNSAIMNRRWVKIAPHLNDRLLFVSGIALVASCGFYPVLSTDTWLTEKLFGVIIYIFLGYRIGQEEQKPEATCDGVYFGLGLPIPDN